MGREHSDLNESYETRILSLFAKYPGVCHIPETYFFVRLQKQNKILFLKPFSWGEILPTDGVADLHGVLLCLDNSLLRKLIDFLQKSDEP